MAVVDAVKLGYGFVTSDGADGFGKRQSTVVI